MDGLNNNPFTALTVIAAPAVLTSATASLILSTNNRFTVAMDLARTLTAKLAKINSGEETGKRESVCEQLDSAQKRIVLIVRALMSYYGSLAAFGLATLTSLSGVIAASKNYNTLLDISLIVALIGGMAGFGLLVYGSSLLMLETRLALQLVKKNTEEVIQC